MLSKFLIKENFFNSKFIALLMIIFMLLGISFIVYFAVQRNILLLLIATWITIFILITSIKPELSTLVVIFMLYTNIPVIAKEFHDIPELIAASVSLLLGIPFIIYIFFQHKKLVIDYVFLLMIVFLAIALVSSMLAKDTDIATQWIITFISEGMLLYFLIINVIRNLNVLKHTIWILLLAGGLLGSLSLYQDITGSVND